MTEETRVCTRCGEEKEMKQFNPRGKICWDCREKARLASNANWRERSKDYLRGRREEWDSWNPDKRTQYGATRRAAKLMAKGIFTQEDLRLIKEAQNSKCVYCNCYLGESYHADHIFPISKYFYNGPENIQLLCGKCNSKKKDTDPYVYEKKIGFSGAERIKRLDEIKAVIESAHNGVSLEHLSKEWRKLVKTLVAEIYDPEEEEALAYNDYIKEWYLELEDGRRRPPVSKKDPPNVYEPRYTYEMWGHV